MEAAGLVVGIVGLYTTCEQCYKCYCSIKNAEDDAVRVRKELEIEESILKAWGLYWDIQPPRANVEVEDDDDDNEPNDKVQLQAAGKLTKYLEKHPYKAEGIASALFLIATTLSNKKMLLNTYGIDIDMMEQAEIIPGQLTNNKGSLAEDVRKNAGLLRGRMTTFRKAKWALKDYSKFKTLIADLTKYNNSLHRLCPEWAVDLLQINLVVSYFSGHRSANPGSLRDSARAVEESSSSGNGPLISSLRQGVETLADVADFRAQVSHGGEPLTESEEGALLRFSPADLDGRDGVFLRWMPKRTTAVCLPTGQAVYVEAHVYEDGKRRRDPGIRDDVLKLGRLLQNPICTKRLLAMELLGLVDFADDNTIRLVYKLPGTLGMPFRNCPVEDTDVRKPMTLLDAIKTDPLPSLEWRLGLAGKLVQSVVFLHASGWLHKNIRAESVYFFPGSGPDTSQELGDADMEKPFLLGFEFSRPDDGKPPARPLVSTAEPREYPTEYPEEDINGPQQPKAPESPIPTPKRRVSFRLEKESHAALRPWDSISQLGSSYHYHQAEYGAFQLNRLDGVKSYITPHPDRINLDFRHHPAKRAYPNRRYCHAFDVYSLGILLVEIGMWSDVSGIWEKIDEAPIADPYNARRRFISYCTPRLRFYCGRVYADAALACLNVEPETTDAGLTEQRELCARVAASLAQYQM